jgi:hypothetical protein
MVVAAVATMTMATLAVLTAANAGDDTNCLKRFPSIIARVLV